MKLLPAALLLFLLSATPTLSKRGGGGGGGSSDSDSDSGDSSSDGGSSDSGGSSGPTVDDCNKALQEQYTYISSPSLGSHYNGTLRVRHTITAYETTSTNPDAVCAPAQLGTKVYSYPDAYLFVGPPNNANDTNPVFWQLTAYIPFTAYSGFGIARGARREIVNLVSQAYTDSRYSFVNGTLDKRESEMRVCWAVDMTRRQDSQGNLTWDLTTNFVRVSEYFGAQSSEMYPDRTSNWMTISDICTNGFETTKYADDVKVPQYNSNAIGAAFIETGANATITNVGGQKVKFKMDNGRIDQGIFGVQKAGNENCEGGQGSQYSDLEAFKPYGSDWGDWNLNLTVDFSLEFEGTLWEEKSSEFNPNATNATTGKAFPRWDSGAGRRGSSMGGEWFLGGVLLAAVVWVMD
jgi:hypothetical protein